MTFIRIEIFTKIDRNEALTSIKDSLLSSEGWIIDHKLYSNTSANIIFEMPLAKLESFFLKLEEEGMKAKLEGDKSEGIKGDVRGTIAMTFIHDEPDLKREVPAFE